jgi:hypothetical protein
MCLDDVAADGQTQSGPTQARGVRPGLGGEEGLEDPSQVLGSDANAVINNAQLGQSTCGIGCQPKPDHASARHRLAGIDQKIDEDLLYLGGVDSGIGTIHELDLEADLVPSQVFIDQQDNFLDQSIQVDRFAVIGIPASA